MKRCQGLLLGIGLICMSLQASHPMLATRTTSTKDHVTTVKVMDREWKLIHSVSYEVSTGRILAASCKSPHTGLFVSASLEGPEHWKIEGLGYVFLSLEGKELVFTSMKENVEEADFIVTDEGSIPLKESIQNLLELLKQGENCHPYARQKIAILDLMLYILNAEGCMPPPVRPPTEGIFYSG